MPDTAAPAIDHAHLASARLWAATRMPYFASALFALRPAAAPELGTLGVDRSWRCYIDPAVLRSWTTPEAGAVLIHEVLHLLRDHAGRADTLGVDTRSAPAWNAACDAEINDDLVAAGLPLPGDPILPATLGQPDGLLAEAYYRPRTAGPDCGSGAHGHPRAHETPGVASLETIALRRSTALDVLEAVGKDPTAVTAGIRRWAAAEVRPTVDWRRELASVIRRSAAQVSGRADYTFSRRSRYATATPGVILPGLARPVPEIAVVCDTSASITDLDLAAARAETESLIAAIGLRSRRITVLAVDTRVRAASRVNRGAGIVLHGGGGTDMAAGIRAAAALRPRPRIVVVLTDGWTPWPAHPPAGVTVVVGLLAVGSAPPPRPPDWAHTIELGGPHR